MLRNTRVRRKTADSSSVAWFINVIIRYKDLYGWRNI